VSLPVPAFVPAADALQEQLLMQLHMLQEQSRRQQEIQRLTPTQETPQQQEADER
jgi:NADH:ubiquinone oxidoreductase subunit B-like Fe-S oxidoreductase